MPDRDHDLVARLDAMGERAAAAVPSVPAALTATVGSRGEVVVRPARQSVPMPALAAAAAVVLAGAALVALRAPVVMRGRGAVVLANPTSLLAMTERFNRDGNVDAALERAAARSASGAAGVPAVRAIDARTGLLPE